MIQTLHNTDAQLPKAARVQLAKKRIAARRQFNIARSMEQRFMRTLRQISRQIGAVAQVMKDDTRALVEQLNRYSDTLRPWATAVAQRMQKEVARRDTAAWESLASTMGRTLRREIESAPVAAVMRDKLAETVDLISSMPRVAAERVQKLATQAMLGSMRADVLKDEIARSGKVSAAHARTIARTELARNASLLTESRALYIGSPGYFWRSIEDSDVRPEHRKLNGKFIPWDKPPVVDRKTGRRAHAGQDINCRCWPEPVIPEDVGVAVN